MNFNDEQEPAIFSDKPQVVVSASAGSGKTRVLTERYLHICEEQLRLELGEASEKEASFAADVEGIVAITFTEKAAREMRDRIRQGLESRLDAAEHFGGETERATSRTFWQRQLDGLTSAPIVTFHSFCNRLLREYAQEGGLSPNYRVLDDVQAKILVQHTLDDILADKECHGRWNSIYEYYEQKSLGGSILDLRARLLEHQAYEGLRAEFNDATSFISQFIGRNSDIDGKHHDAVGTIACTVADILLTLEARYGAAKRACNLLDFSDLQHRAYTLLANPEVVATCYARFRHFLVDESQDTNALQISLLKRIDPAYRFIVGDVKQSIYRFRGADVGLFQEVIHHAQTSKDGEFIDMNINYRTCDSILQFVNGVFEQAMRPTADNPNATPYSPIRIHRKGEQECRRRVEFVTVTKEEPRGDEAHQDLREGREDGGHQEERDMTSSTAHTDEYESIANRMRQLIASQETIVEENRAWRAPQWRDMAILLRARTHLPKLEKALTDRNVPYVVYGGLGFYEKQEVLDMLSLLRWIDKPWEPACILAVLRSPMVGMDINELLEIRASVGAMSQLGRYIYDLRYREDTALSNDTRGKLSSFYEVFSMWVPFPTHQPLLERLTALFEQSGLYTSLLLQRNSLQKVRNVEKLIQTLASLGLQSLNEMLLEIDRIAAASDKEGEAEYELAEGNSVHVMTIHAAKGLEFPIVFVPGIATGPQNDKGHIRFDKEDRFVFKFNARDGLAKPKEVKGRRFVRSDECSKRETFEEYKRLFYVATTRARDYLVLSCTLSPGQEPKEDAKSAYDLVANAINNDPKLSEFVTVYDSIPNIDVVNAVGAEWYPGPNRDLSLTEPVTFSVSEVVTFLDSPLKYYDKYVIKVNPAWFESASQHSQKTDVDPSQSVESTVLGTLVHAACELMDAGFSGGEAIEEALFLLDEEPDRDKYRAGVTELVDSYPSIANSIPGTTVATEFPFELCIGTITIIGKIDKVVRDGDAYHVIDLKTNRIDDVNGLTDYYKPQLYLYKIAYEAATKVTVSNMSLVFLRDTERGLHPVEFESAYESLVRGAVELMAGMKRRNASRVEYERMERLGLEAFDERIHVGHKITEFNPESMT